MCAWHSCGQLSKVSHLLSEIQAQSLKYIIAVMALFRAGAVDKCGADCARAPRGGDIETEAPCLILRLTVERWETATAGSRVFRLAALKSSA